MRPIVLMTAVASVFAISGCAVRSYDYVRPDVYETSTLSCDPNSPCGNTYYWDEWREVYVYYDGYRYWDATGLPGTYPEPPSGLFSYAPPYGYVPPSDYRPPHGRYHSPPGYRSRDYGNPRQHEATAVTLPRGNPEPQPPSGNAWGNGGNARPPSGHAYGPPAAAPPSGSAYGPPSGAPPSGSAYGPPAGSAPPSGSAYGPPAVGGGVPPARNGGGGFFDSPPRNSAPPSGSVSVPPAERALPAPPSGNAYVPPPPPPSRGGFFEPAPVQTQPAPGNSYGGRGGFGQPTAQQPPPPPPAGNPNGGHNGFEGQTRNPPNQPPRPMAQPEGNAYGGRNDFNGQRQPAPRPEELRPHAEPQRGSERPPLREVPYTVDLPPVPTRPLPTRDVVEVPPTPSNSRRPPPSSPQPVPGTPGPGFPPPMR